MGKKSGRNRQPLMRTEEDIRIRIEQTIVEEIQATNLITQREPENYLPRFVETLANRLAEVVLDEIAARRRF